MKPFITLQELILKLEKKEVSPREVALFYADRIKKYNPSLNAVIQLFEDAVENYPSDKTGKLAGVPFLHKDNICKKDRTTSAGSKILANYQATYDATVMKRLAEDGAITIGRTNCDEFAMGGSGEYSAYGATRNPWDLNRVPGGSSSGSAAAVSAGLVPFALGTETGGSVRQPASFCNLVGMYPTYGRNSRYGTLAFTSSTDQVGVLTKTVYDNALVMSSMSGKDPYDTTSIQEDSQDFTQGLDGKLPEGLTLGIIKDALDSDGINPEVRKAFDDAVTHLKTLGAKIKSIELPHLKYAIAVYFILSRVEASSNLYRYDGALYGMRNHDAQDLFKMYVETRHDGFGQEVKRRILTGNYALSAGHQEAYYSQANHVRKMILAEFENSFKEVDLLISPTAPSLPFKIGEMLKDPITMYLADYFTVPNCVIGTPAISLPCGFSSSGLPIGFQFLGPQLSESLLYKAAHAFQQTTNFHLKNPKGYE